MALRNSHWWLLLALFVVFSTGDEETVTTTTHEDDGTGSAFTFNIPTPLHCGCHECSDNVLARRALWTGIITTAREVSCGFQIRWWQGHGDYRFPQYPAEKMACQLVARQHPQICGPECDPNQCDGKPWVRGNVCGCPNCTDEILSRTAGSYQCRQHINYLGRYQNHTESEACLHVSSVYPDICGPECDPSKCHLLVPSRAPSATSTTTTTPTTSPCLCPLCTQEILSRQAGNYQCQEHIQYLINVESATEKEACTRISSVYPEICGPECDPQQCESTNGTAASTSTRCGCPSCHTGILSRKAGNYQCEEHIQYLIDHNGATEMEACAHVSTVYPAICGPQCDPAECHSLSPVPSESLLPLSNRPTISNSSPSTTPSMIQKTDTPVKSPFQLPSNITSTQPSHSPSGSPSYGPTISVMCPSGQKVCWDGSCVSTYTDCPCITGKAHFVRAACAHPNSNCCYGGSSTACYWDNLDHVLNVTVCPGSCNGDRACDLRASLENFRYVATRIRIGYGSCNAALACSEAVANVGDKSCNDQEACKLSSGPKKEGSCNYKRACVNSGHIGSLSCNAVEACFVAANVGGNSCNANESCVDVVKVGDLSCNAQAACKSSSSNGGTHIGNLSCNAHRACVEVKEVAHRSCNAPFACDSATEVGNMSCNEDIACQQAWRIWDASCNAVEACHLFSTNDVHDKTNAIVGPSSCNGMQACVDANVLIGSGSCNAMEACGFSRLDIGNGVCNTEQSCANGYPEDPCDESNENDLFGCNN